MPSYRPTLDGLIARLRRMIHDPAGESPTWADDALQEFLDARKAWSHNRVLHAEPTLGSTVLYLTYHAGLGDWEDDVVLRDAHYAVVVPAASDPIGGVWSFTTEPEFPLTVTGKTFDLNGAAADVLDAWAAREKMHYSFSTNEQRFSRRERLQAMRELASDYRRRSRPRSATLVRSDVAATGPEMHPDAILRR